jgi:hypothetical protein
VADGVRVEVRGVQALAEGSAKLADNIERAAHDSFAGVAETAADDTRGRLHSLTGATVASVRAEQTKDGALVTMGEGVPYAQYEEYGGRGWPHSPTGNFLYPAATSAEPLLIAAAEKTAEQEIGAMTWPSP